jgi:HPt (histidine-containing phosphotransfer) domain-containing protein
MLAGVAGGSGLVAELVGLFVDDVPPRLHLIREAVRREDTEALQRPAHSLKGSASTLGADRMAELCRELETLAGTRDWPRAGDVVASLGAEFERVKRALADWLAAR